MRASGPRYSKVEFARRGDEIYEHSIRPTVCASDQGKFVAIDIESGEFEIDANEMTACDRLEVRVADPQIWLVRIGFRAVRHFRSPRHRH